MLIRASELRHRYGDRTTLDGVGFSLASRDRVALTGRNGAGKTTLLRVILGVVRPDSGELEIAAGTRIGALEQDPMYPAGLSVLEVMRGALGHVRELEGRLRVLESQLEEPEAQFAYSEALEAFEQAGGYSAEARAMATLSALRLDDFLERDAVTLSGGERTRLALACALVDQPDVLVLDEPTNHLDIGMREWLEGRLRDYPGALLIVSHDRTLLDAVANETWHLERGQLTAYRGGYSSARMQRLEARRVQAKQNRIGGFEVRRLEQASKVMAAWGKNNEKLAKRAKAIAKRAERARDVLVEAPIRERKITMALEAGNARAKVVLRAEHVFKHYQERLILEDANVRVRAGDRIALLAPNGAGKTTLLRILLGETAPDPSTVISSTDGPVALEPVIRYADGVLPAYFDQTYHGLNPNQAIFEQLSLRVGESATRALLGRYGFRPEDWPKRPRELSGGERARAGLALVAATRADILILDEPTNHLDVEALELLEDALLAYPGSILFVTHDRSFAQAVATRVLGIEHGKLIEYAGGFDGYVRAKRGDKSTLDPARLLEGEDVVKVERVFTTAQRIQLLEERLIELDAIFLRGGLTTREFDRLKREESQARAWLDELYGEAYGADTEFTHAVQSGLLEVRCDPVGSSWRFWAKGADDCPSLGGTLEHNEMRLEWIVPDGGAKPLRWFSSALMAGAIRMALEHLGASMVNVPEFGSLKHMPLEPLEHGRFRLSSLDYARWLGLMPPPKPLPKRWHLHASFPDWARARLYRRRFALNRER